MAQEQDKRPSDEVKIDELAAFADGELDGPDGQQVIDRIARDPQAAKRLLHHQQLHEAVSRVMKASLPDAAPPALRGRIEQLSASTAPQPPSAAEARADRFGCAGPPAIGRIGQWVPAAVAAVLLIVSGVLLYNVNRNGRDSRDSESSIIPASMADKFSLRHVRCVGDITRLMDSDEFPKDIKELPAKLNLELGGQATPSLDLSSLGYEFHAAGHCNVPGKGAVHLVYHAKEKSGRYDALSLWIKTYQGRPLIDAGKLYGIGGEESAHPMLIWRDQTMVYYLVGDATDYVEKAARVLRGG